MPPTPFDSRELTLVASALLLLACSWRFRAELARVPGRRLLMTALAFLALGHVATVAEHFIAPIWLDRIEHFAYGLQSVLLAIWAFATTRTRGSA
ncbi:MAG TPA: hypothetical protein VLC09_09320 [Polyangiaceae bacterium]|nr:hypothetical protein [Polyangiaceae bacterium]